jgi:hypothetical protein
VTHNPKVGGSNPPPRNHLQASRCPLAPIGYRIIIGTAHATTSITGQYAANYLLPKAESFPAQLRGDPFRKAKSSETAPTEGQGSRPIVPPFCPQDGWSRPYFQRLFEVAKEMEKSGENISIELLRLKGFDKESLDRVIVVEFGSDVAVFDGIIPAGYLIDGTFIPLVKLDRQYL